MKTPILHYQSSEFSREIGEIDAWRDRLDRQYPLSRQWTGVMRRDLEAESVAASTSMEGVPVTVDDVRRILAGDRPASVAPADQDLVRGYRDAMTFVQRRADDPNFRWNRELIVGVQDRVLAANHAAGAGRIREGEVRVVKRHSTTEVFKPPPASDVPRRVDQICDWLNHSDHHPALNAAWCHVAIAAVHPFRDGNGRTARVMASQAIYRGGFRSPTFTSLEEWWGDHPDDYYTAFDCLGTEYDDRADVTPFIAAHLAAQLRQVRAIDLREKTTRGLWTAIENLLRDRDLPDRIALAVWDAFFGFTVTSGSYRGAADVSPATASADLRTASVVGLLTPQGAGRSRSYQAGEAMFKLIADEIGLPPFEHAAEDHRGAIIADLAMRVSSDNPLS